MKKKKMCRLLNEALVNRTITGASVEVVVDKSYGELLVPCFEVDNFLKVMVGLVVPKKGDPSDLVMELAKDHAGNRIECVFLDVRDGEEEQPVLSIEVGENIYPLWDVGLVDSSSTCQLSHAFLGSGLQSPYEVI